MMNTSTMSDDSSGRAIIYPPMPKKGFFLWHKTRFIVILIATLCLSCIMANSLVLNFTVICMTGPKVVETLNGTDVQAPVPLFTENEKSWLFSAIAIGTIIGTVPISYFTNTFGVRRSFAVYGYISAISTLLLPMATDFGFGAVFFIRVLQGFAVAMSFPAMGSITAEYSTLARSGTYVAFISCHLQLGPIVTMSSAGEFCSSAWGWPAVYYFLGTITLILMSSFVLFYRNNAAKHPNVSSLELAIIRKNKENTSSKTDEPVRVPYKAIFLDRAVLGCILSCFSSNLAYNTFIQYGPTYLHNVLHFNVQSTGLIAALPGIICIFVKFAAGPLSDSMPFLGARGRVIVFATVSQFGVAFCFVTLAFLPADMPTIAQVFFTGAIVFSGLNCVGVIKSCQLISGRFAYVIMAMHSFSNSCIVLVLPGLVRLLAPNNSAEEWARLLVLIAVIVAAAIVIFDITAQATPRRWALSCCEAQLENKVGKTFPVSLDIEDLKTSMPEDPMARKSDLTLFKKINQYARAGKWNGVTNQPTRFLFGSEGKEVYATYTKLLSENSRWSDKYPSIGREADLVLRVLAYFTGIYLVIEIYNAIIPETYRFGYKYGIKHYLEEKHRHEKEGGHHH
ncbi:Vesicular glutamate transporter 2 [Aphelenchoides besseyi]|nr:Vesicular glutamate transporter 2 [Aphelenchoides besseyi]